MIKATVFLASMATLAFGALSAGRADGPLDADKTALRDAKSLTVAFSTLKGGENLKSTLSYSKPNLFRIETPNRLTVCDGKTVWDLNKADNTYTKVDVSTARTMEDDVWAWAAFFSKDVFKDAANVTPGAKHQMKGATVQDVSMDLPGSKTAIVFLDADASFARGSDVKKGDAETLTIASEVKLGIDAMPDSTYAFAVPDGAKLAVKSAGDDIAYSKIDAIFQASCMPCHSAASAKGGANLSAYANVMAGSSTGALVVAGDPDKSLIVQYITGSLIPRMPKGSGPLSDGDIKLIEDWIKAGAKGPSL